MISHIDENNTNEIEIHEFINLLDSVDGTESESGSSGLDGMIETIAKSLAFNIDDISSKYESDGHMREFKQHKRMLTLSGRRSLLHENNYISNKPNITNENSACSDSNLTSPNSPYFKNRDFEIDNRIRKDEAGSEEAGASVVKEASLPGDSYNVNTKADYWNHHSSSNASQSSFKNVDLEPCSELDKIAQYLDQNFDRVRHDFLFCIMFFKIDNLSCA